VAQRVGRGTALPFHDRGTRRGSVVSNTPRPHFTPGKDPVSILQEAGWAPGPVWTGGKSQPHRNSIMGNYATHFALFVQLDNKQRIRGKVTEWSAGTLLITFTSEFATLYTTIYIIIEK